MFEIISTCKGGGYRYCRTNPPHPKRNAKGLYPLHRVLVENRLGRLLKPGEEVHHKDEDKTNDDPDNLEVKTSAEHARLHALERGGEDISVQCPVCESEFSMRPYQHRLRSKRSVDGKICCSRSCSVKRQNRLASSKNTAHTVSTTT